jgi:ubiquinone/menaquinone biosynthesis C-methylase UbiE
MPDTAQNIEKWNSFEWRQGGDEWSEWWGGPKAQWRATVYPRIRAFLPAKTLVEIAPGYGRWTQFLRDHCEKLIGVDISEECVRGSRERCRGDDRLRFHVTDGKTLVGVADRSADFVFSFDSLVHVEQDVMAAYLAEIARVLTPGGVAVLHHSNMAAYADQLAVGEETPHWRGRTVSAATVVAAADQVGLHCFRQELITWGRRHDFLVDALSWITRTGSEHDGTLAVTRNADFMDEADCALARATRGPRAIAAARRRVGAALRRLNLRG